MDRLLPGADPGAVRLFDPPGSPRRATAGITSPFASICVHLRLKMPGFRPELAILKKNGPLRLVSVDHFLPEAYGRREQGMAGRSIEHSGRYGGTT